MTINRYRYEMKSYDELRAEMEVIQKMIVEAKKNKYANTLKEVKCLCRECGFFACMLKGSLSETERNNDKPGNLSPLPEKSYL